MMNDTPLERIMLVDDEKMDQMIYSRVIKRSGLASDVIGFTKAEEALAYLRDPDSPQISLILLDIRMPVMSGFEFLEAAEPYLPDTHVIPVIMMLTTSMSAQDRSTAEKFKRIKSYLSKPLRPEHLEAAVDTLRDARAEIGL